MVERTATPRVTAQPSQVLGASSTDVSTLPQGALAGVLGNQNLESAMNLARSLYPQREPVDPALLSLMFFSQMAAEASKPGATALGAAGTAAMSPAQYLIQDAQLRRKEEATLPTTAVQLATLMNPKGTGKGIKLVKLDPVMGSDNKVMRSADGAPMYHYIKQDAAGNQIGEAFTGPDTTAMASMKPITLYNDAGQKSLPVVFGSQDYEKAKAEGFTLTDKPSKTTLKSMSLGSAVYMSPENAKTFLERNGLKEGDPNYVSIFEKIATDEDDKIGKAIVLGNNYQELTAQVRDGEIIGINLGVAQGGQPPPSATFQKKRSEALADIKTEYVDKAATVIPKVNEAMDLLLSGNVETGRLAQVLQPFKQIFSQTFGVKDPQIVGFETLEQVSYFLAPKMRPSGSGSTSDIEFAAYQKASVSMGNTPEANYISLYAFKKMAENGMWMNDTEIEMLEQGATTKEINQELRKVDKGIFEKYTGDPNNQEEFDAFYNALPNGAVVINNGIFDSMSPYIIKGWGAQ